MLNLNNLNNFIYSNNKKSINRYDKYTKYKSELNKKNSNNNNNNVNNNNNNIKNYINKTSNKENKNSDDFFNNLTIFKSSAKKKNNNNNKNNNFYFDFEEKSNEKNNTTKIKNNSKKLKDLISIEHNENNNNNNNNNKFNINFKESFFNNFNNHIKNIYKENNNNSHNNNNNKKLNRKKNMNIISKIIFGENINKNDNSLSAISKNSNFTKNNNSNNNINNSNINNNNNQMKILKKIISNKVKNNNLSSTGSYENLFQNNITENNNNNKYNNNNTNYNKNNNNLLLNNNNSNKELKFSSRTSFTSLNSKREKLRPFSSINTSQNINNNNKKTNNLNTIPKKLTNDYTQLLMNSFYKSPKNKKIFYNNNNLKSSNSEIKTHLRPFSNINKLSNSNFKKNNTNYNYNNNNYNININKYSKKKTFDIFTNGRNKNINNNNNNKTINQNKYLSNNNENFTSNNNNNNNNNEKNFISASVIANNNNNINININNNNDKEMTNKINRILKLSPQQFNLLIDMIEDNDTNNNNNNNINASFKSQTFNKKLNYIQTETINYNDDISSHNNSNYINNNNSTNNINNNSNNNINSTINFQNLLKFTIKINSIYNENKVNNNNSNELDNNNNNNYLAIEAIEIYDKNNNIIPIICCNSNCINNNNNVINIFNNNNNENYNDTINNSYFITEFIPNLYINFYIDKINEKNINYINIINYPYFDDMFVSPIKEIELFNNDNKFFQGNLNVNNQFNIINLNNINNNNNIESNRNLRSKTFNIIDNNNIIIFNDKRPFSSTKKTSFKNHYFKSSIELKNLSKYKIYSDRQFNNTNIKKNTNISIENNNINYYYNDNSSLSNNNNNTNNTTNQYFDNFLRTSIGRNTSFHIPFNFSTNYNNFIQFFKIKLVLSQNYGHRKFIGLTGLEFYDINDNLINIESAITIGAMPKDLRTVYDDENDERIFENIFNNNNNTNDDYNMWLTCIKNNEPLPYIEICFKEKQKIKEIKIFNYNHKDFLDCCTKSIDVYLDDNFYDTIYLFQGIGISCVENDFAQEIFFPIKNKDFEDENNQENFKFASFLYEQCYETVYLPTGYIIKLVLVSNNMKKKNFENFIVGFKDIQIFNENGNNLINNNNIKYKILYNSYKINNDEFLFKLNNNNNNFAEIFFVFERPIFLSYINIVNLNEFEYNANEIKIFIDTNIIFEGCLNKDCDTVILFTCDMKITKNLDEKLLSKPVKKREIQEEKNDKFTRLILN